jgi:hypothetical protein
MLPGRYGHDSGFLQQAHRVCRVFFRRLSGSGSGQVRASGENALTARKLIKSPAQGMVSNHQNF